MLEINTIENVFLCILVLIVTSSIARLKRLIQIFVLLVCKSIVKYVKTFALVRCFYQFLTAIR